MSRPQAGDDDLMEDGDGDDGGSGDIIARAKGIAPISILIYICSNCLAREESIDC